MHKITLTVKKLNVYIYLYIEVFIVNAQYRKQIVNRNTLAFNYRLNRLFVPNCLGAWDKIVHRSAFFVISSMFQVDTLAFISRFT